MSGKTLHLSFAASDQPNTDDDNTFVISEDLGDSEDDWFTRLNSLQISQDSRFSYQLFWPHLVLASRGKLLIYVKLYSELSRCVENENIDQIMTHGLRKGYRLVADDLSDKYGIAVVHDQGLDEGSSFLSKFLIRFSVVLLFVDQILSMIKERITSSSQTLRDEPLFFPYPDRYESMMPIIRDLDRPANIVVTPLTISWRILNPVTDWPENHGTRTLTEFADWSTFREQVSSLFHLQKGILCNNLGLSQKLDDQLQDEYDVSLPRTTEHVCQTVLRQDIRHFLSFPLLENAIEETEPSSVIVGGMNPRDRYALEVGENMNADLYYLPHSIVYDCEVVPQITETTHFVAGKADERVLQNNYKEEDLPDIRPVGRPYLDNLATTGDQRTDSSSNPVLILGTQPYDDWIRDMFVRDVLDGLENSEFSAKVIIKVHPSESIEYYEEIPSEYEYNIDIRTGDIREYINQKTVLITINSNVGLEGILSGAYCISYNPFEPFVQPSSYIDGDYVPYTTTLPDLQVGLEAGLNEKASQKEQQEYIRKSYSITDSSSRISELIIKENRDLKN